MGLLETLSINGTQHRRHSAFATLSLLGQFSTLSTNETQHIDIQCNNTQLNRLIRDEQHSVKQNLSIATLSTICLIVTVCTNDTQRKEAQHQVQ